ncbi:NUDIX hydrolase [Actinomycetospora soli]|uniref:NUDIX hydrolase n=1 Tax=Actinomycetospora soli TaxID=2893887 RepID=UPI001E3F77D6|nr:NUDIX hydrolase [Actinomycetospora soli]MCD2191466.1 NUDIX hydrolase [Actinomycetospora soli]
MADTPKHSVSVAGIVVDDQDRVLVIKRRDNGHWEPPGGVLELDETPEQGVQREVYEETGVEVDVVALSGIYKNMSRGVVSLVFRCWPRAGSARASDEASAVRWVKFEDVGKDMDEAYRVRITDAWTDEVAVRSHDGVNVLAG